MRTRSTLAFTLLVAGLSLSVARADDAYVQINPENVNWERFADYGDNVHVTTMYGGVKQAAIYTFRVKMSDGAKLKIHTHPDTRMITVLSGTVFAGRGTKYDTANEVAVSAGGFFTVPAGSPHYTRVGDGEVIYQESGFGPTPTVPIN